MISFNGQYIRDLNVLKRNSRDSSYSSEKLSFVKLDPANIKDVQPVALAVVNWKEATGVGNLMAQDLCFSHYLTQEKYLAGAQLPDYYIATRQTDDFDNIDSNSIVGAIQVNQESDDTQEIKYFEVCPRYSHNNKERTMKNIGHEMLVAVMDIYSKNKYKVKPLHRAISFYEKEGFKEIDCENMIFDKTV